MYFNYIFDLTKHKKFTNKVYNNVSSLNSTEINLLYEKVFHIPTFNKNDEIISFIIDNNNNIEELTIEQFEINDSIPFYMSSENIGLVCYFPSKKTIINKINSTNNNCVAYELILHKDNNNNNNNNNDVMYGHSQMIFLNGNINELTIYNSNTENNYIDENMLNTSLNKYCDMINFKFNGILNLGINYKNEKILFGSCRAWTLFMIMLSTVSIDEINLLKNLNKLKLMKLIERFHIFICLMLENV